ncbi:MAG: GNAT family N-acetyltransferase [Chloroflexi bacterium]|nr:GNAT family N-acetyltransferase [Chloroflexota bacterium]
MLRTVVPDEALVRRLARHEASIHAFGKRQVRDLGDAVLLHDPTDHEPFWNRVAAPAWPDDARAFERRLDEVVTLFATLDRLPHIRTLALANRPADLGARLAAAGFRTVGVDRSMILADTGPCLALARRFATRPDLAVEHVGRGPELRAIEVARLLVHAFDVESDRVPALGAETLAAGRRPGGAVLLVLEAGQPAAVARRVAEDGGTYLSSIATSPLLQGRGFGSLVTALAVAEALEAGTEFIHLLVEADNHVAIGVYERLGFITLGEPLLDLLLR